MSPRVKKARKSRRVHLMLSVKGCVFYDLTRRQARHLRDYLNILLGDR